MAEAISTPPTPNVVDLVGPCRRLKKSENFTNASEPMSAVTALTSSIAAISVSAQIGRCSSGFIRCSFDDVAAGHVFGQRHRSDEAQQRHHQRCLEQEL